MKFCSLFKKDSPCDVELQMAETQRNIDETNRQIDSMKATLDGETEWFLVVESAEARNREKQLTHTLEMECTQT